MEKEEEEEENCIHYFRFSTQMVLNVFWRCRNLQPQWTRYCTSLDESSLYIVLRLFPK